MKKTIFIAMLLLLLKPMDVFAHGDGSSNYLLINNESTIPNPIQEFGITASSFLIPKQLAPDTYLVNQNINFEIDTEDLADLIPNEALNTTKFEWDYGDGAKASGLKNSRSYKTTGSYVLVLTINIPSKESAAPTQLEDSFLINIIPSRDFSDLPQAVIKFNEKKVENPLKETQTFSFNKSVQFDAGESKESSVGIAEYIWSFGDGQTSTKKIDNHKYKEGDFQTVVLRVKDKNGFISDAFVGLISSERAKPTNSSFPKIEIIVIVVIFLASLFIIFLATKRKRLA